MKSEEIRAEGAKKEAFLAPKARFFFEGVWRKFRSLAGGNFNSLPGGNFPAEIKKNYDQCDQKVGRRRGRGEGRSAEGF